MIEAGEVGAVFRIVNEASAELIALAEQFAKLDGAINTSREKLARFGRPLSAELSTSLRTVIEQFAEITRLAGTAREKIVADFSEIDGAARTSIGLIGGYSKSFADLGTSAETAANTALTAIGRLDTRVTESAASMASLNAESAKASIRHGPQAFVQTPSGMTPIGGGGGRRGGDGGEGGGGGRGHGVHFRSHEIGPVTVTPHATGFYPLIAGLFAGWGIEKLVKEGGELTSEQQKLRGMGGISEPQISEATRLAQSYTGSVVGTTIAENLKGIRELIPVTPSLEAAEEVYPMVMRAAKVLESLTGKPAIESLQPLGKSIELMGGGADPKTHKLDAERFAHTAETLAKVIIASGGLANAQTILAFAQQAGAMGRMMADPEVLMKQMLTAILDMSGNRAGTALTAVGRQILGGKMLRQSAEEMQEMGLLIKGKWHKSGIGVQVDPGGVVGEDEIKDPTRGLAGWMKDVMTPALAAHGKTSAADVLQELIKMFGTSTAQRMAALFVQNEEQQKRDAQLISNVKLGDAYSGMVGNDWDANAKNMSAAFGNLTQAFGAPSASAAITGMQMVASAMNKLSAAALAHPDIAKHSIEGATAVAGALALGGSLKMLQWLFSGFGSIGRLFGAGAKPGAAAAAEAGAAATTGASAAEAAALAGAGGGLKGALTGGAAAGIIAVIADWVHGEAMDALGKWLASKGAVDTSAAAQAARSKEFDEKVLGKIAPATVPPGFHFLTGDEESRVFHSDPAAERHAWSHSYDGKTPRLPPGLLAPIGNDIQGALGKIPGQVQPSISAAFAAIGGSLSAAIAGLAGAAGAAKGISPAVKAASAGYGLPTGSSRVASASSAPAAGQQVASNAPGSASKPIEIHLTTMLDGARIAKVVTKYQTADVSFPTQAPYHDSRGYASAPDIGYAVG